MEKEANFVKIGHGVVEKVVVVVKVLEVTHVTHGLFLRFLMVMSTHNPMYQSQYS